MTDVDRLAHLRHAKDLMDRAYGEPLDLDAIAREAGYSRFHFVRAFRATYGQTPRDYLSGRRVERARELLRTANLTVTEVCFLVGFSSLGSFSARFKEEVGVSPSRYRDRAVRRGGAPPIPGCFVLMWTQPRAQSGRSHSDARSLSSIESERKGEVT
ncbi:MAG: helix-turn-helix transcriptional regulator [Chloroflexi bacterium]|nr:MAG: helix-turn-helix transcriptional regulator [Chloroflexota bacterium]HKC90097.1 helix-turn-helix transcriptional regulator [Candidatus Limnocylindria bacterium]